MSSKNRITIDEQSKTGVHFIEDYNEFLEDVHDLSVIAERRDEPLISMDELKNRLKKDGIMWDSV